MRSYLVVGNQTLDSPELAEAIRERMAAGPARFHIVVPATPVQRGLTWDEDKARIVAQDRLTAAISRLVELDAEVTGEIGHRDPIEATEDALRGREVDEVILSTLPPGISRWLGQDVPTRLKGSVLVPVSVVTTQNESVPATPS
jgi:GABA permease